jgi:hypothetical protein
LDAAYRRLPTHPTSRGGQQLAEEDLRLRLASGEVEVQDRLVAPGKGIEIFPLSPENFKGPDPLWFDSYEDGDSMFLDLIAQHRFHGHNFFVRRSAVYRFWPSAGEAKKPREAALPTTRPNGIGPKVWL